MNSQFLSICKVHEFLTGHPPSLNTISERVQAQKIIYLANAVGINCGDYIFTWYKKGPYSPALTRILYDNISNSNNDTNKYYLRDDVKVVLNPLKNLISNNRINLSQVDWLELLASVHFLYHDKVKFRNLKDLTKELLSYSSKMKYSPKDVERAYNALEKYGIIA